VCDGRKNQRNEQVERFSREEIIEEKKAGEPPVFLKTGESGSLDD
jgi:hypothetical protein